MMLCATFTLDAQMRYLEPVFDEVQVTTDIVYGVNATVLTLGIFGEAVPQELKLDFYEPVGDTTLLRPLVLIFSTGNFLPQTINGSVYGTKSDSSSVETATRLAKMGYAVACVEYRTGWNPFAPTQPERAFQLIQAAYRGVQDARTAVRFFKKDFVENGNSFGVDTARITYFGYGTGGYVSVNAAYLDEYSEIVTTTNPAGKFLLPDPTTGIPTIPMIIEAVNGDVEGKTVGVVPPGFEPIPAGDTLNYPNHAEYSSEVQLVVNAAGALGDISWLDEGEIPVIAFQNPEDEAAPYKSSIVIVPTTGDGIVEAQGCHDIVESANALGNQDVFKTADAQTILANDPFTQAAIAASAKAGHPYHEGLFPINIELDAFGNENGDPWQWWDSEFWSTVVADTISGATWDQVARSDDGFASAEYAKTYIDTVIGYFAPRAYIALNLQAKNPTQTIDLLQDSQVGLQLAPNPAAEVINIETNFNYPIQRIEVLDLSGKVVQQSGKINASFHRIQRNGLPNGIYIAKLHFKEGVLSKKIIFN